jgi:hypothetical protein
VKNEEWLLWNRKWGLKRDQGRQKMHFIHTFQLQSKQTDCGYQKSRNVSKDIPRSCIWALASMLGWTWKIPNIWTKSYISALARKPPQEPGSSELSQWSAGFPLSKQRHSAQGWADRRASVILTLIKAFKSWLWRQGILDFWSLSVLPPWAELFLNVSFLVKSKRSHERSSECIFAWWLPTVVIFY